MIDLSLPYPGYNWQITQHMGMANRLSLTALLEAADLFKDSDELSLMVSNYMSNKELLTENIRSDTGRSDTWRDYQQILSELGLIISTSIIREIVLTPIGLTYLDEELTYEEMMTTQALRYQYPNGYKGIPYASRQYAQDKGISKRYMLDALNGVRVKPAVLILRMLLTAFESNPSEAYLTSAECATALIPIRSHDDPTLPYQNVLHCRKYNVATDDSVLKRNCAEWFSLLIQTNLFTGDRTQLRLSDEAIADFEEVKKLCTYHEVADDEFWAPSGSEDDPLNWFSYYGSPSVETMAQITRSSTVSVKDDLIIEHAEEIIASTNKSLNLVSFSEAPNTESASDAKSAQYSPEAIERAVRKRTEAGRRHEEVVGLARERLIDAGFEVYKSDAVDLLGKKEDKVLIIEAKTITKSNVISQTRKGLMQLCEYRFRYCSYNDRGKSPETMLLLSSHANYENWRLAFMKSLEIGCANINADDSYTCCVSGPIAKSVFNYSD